MTTPSIVLCEFELEGSEFVHDLTNQPSTTKIIVKSEIQSSKEEANKQFQLSQGPQNFQVILKKLIILFGGTSKITDHTFRIVRRMHLFEEIYNLFEESVEELKNTPSILVKACMKAYEIKEDPDVFWILNDDRRSRNSEIIRDSVANSLQRITDVRVKLDAIISQDIALLKLLPTATLIKFIEFAALPMIAKFSKMPWMETQVKNRVTPKYYNYWKKFWSGFFMRNFNMNEDTCYKIADYMPMELKQDTFVEFLRKRYNAKTLEFTGERTFDVIQEGVDPYGIGTVIVKF